MQCDIREEKRGALSQTSHEMFLFSRGLQHNRSYPADRWGGCYFPEARDSTRVYGVEPPGDQGGKGMRTGMSWFVVCVHVYVLVHKPALCTYQTLSRYQILFPFLFVYLTAPFGLPSSLPLFPCWTKIQKWNVYLAIWCWVEFYIPCSQNIL